MGKGRTFSDPARDSVYQKEYDNEVYSTATQQNSYNLGSTHFSDQSGIGNFTQAGSDQRKANLKGALFQGNIGFNQQTAVLDVPSTTINLLEDGASLALALVSTDKIVSLSTGTVSDLVTITGAQRPGQRLFLYGILGNTITIKHTVAATANTILTPDEGDFDFSDNMVIELVYDISTSKWRIVGTPSGGGGAGNVPNGTIENQHIEWDNVGNQWLAVTFSTYGATGPFADQGSLRFPNDVIWAAGRTGADDGNMELKFTTQDEFDFTASNNADVVLLLRAQDAVDPDQLFLIEQQSGATGQAILTAPNNLSIFTNTVTANVLFSPTKALFATDISLDTNEVFLDADEDSGIVSTVDDTVQIFTNNIIRFAVQDTLTTVGTDLDITTGNNILGGGAGEGMTNVGHFDFIDNLATPAAAVSLYSDGTDLFANTGGGVVNFSDVGGGVFPDNTFRITGSGDATKLLAFEVDTFTTATTRTFGWPDANGTVFVTPAQEDLDLNTFDIFDIDQLTFMSTVGTLSSLNVGFGALGGGGFRANVLNNGDFELTEENVLHFAFDGGSNTIRVVDALFSVDETVGSTSFSISKFNGRTDLSDPTELNLQIAGLDIMTLNSSTIDLANGISFTNVDQIGFRIVGNIIQDDTGGMIFSTPVGDDFNWDDGTDIFASLDKDLFALQFASIQIPRIAQPPDPGANDDGKIFHNSADNRLSYLRRNDGDTAFEVIDLEAGAGGSSNEIAQLNSRVTVTDTGTDGLITFVTDGFQVATMDDVVGLTMTGGSADIDLGTNELFFGNSNSFIHLDVTDNGMAIQNQTSDQVNFKWLAALEYHFTETVFDLHSNNIDSVGPEIRFQTSGNGLFWPIGTGPNETQITASTSNMRFKTGSAGDEFFFTQVTTDLVEINSVEMRLIDSDLEMDLTNEIRWSNIPGNAPAIRAPTVNLLEVEMNTAGIIEFQFGTLYTVEFDEQQTRLVGNFSNGMGFEVFRDDSTPNDGDDIGTMRWSGRDSIANKVVYAEIFAEMIDVTNGTTDGRMDLLVQSGGGFGFFMSGEGNDTSGIEKIGFRGAAAQAAQTWSATGQSVDRSLTGSGNTELRDVLGTLINDLEAMGILA